MGEQTWLTEASALQGFLYLWVSSWLHLLLPFLLSLLFMLKNLLEKKQNVMCEYSI